MTKKGELTREEIIHLAKLSNLKLTDKEIEKYQKQLEETVEYVENLNELDTSNVASTSQTTNLKNVLFEDGKENKRSLSEEETLRNAKSKKDRYFVVKRVI